MPPKKISSNSGAIDRVASTSAPESAGVKRQRPVRRAALRAQESISEDLKRRAALTAKEREKEDSDEEDVEYNLGDKIYLSNDANEDDDDDDDNSDESGEYDDYSEEDDDDADDDDDDDDEGASESESGGNGNYAYNYGR